MAVTPIASPPRIWWRPFGRPERLWLSVSVVFLLVLFVTMPTWVVVGQQNPPNTFYRVSPAQYKALTDNFIARYRVGHEGFLPVVRPPAGTDAYLMAEQWIWTPILQLRRGVTYRLHVSSIDVEHGFSLQPVDMNLQVAPGYDEVVTFTPQQDGVYTIVCNEYCGLGHATMAGRIIVRG